MLGQPCETFVSQVRHLNCPGARVVSRQGMRHLTRSQNSAGTFGSTARPAAHRVITPAPICVGRAHVEELVVRLDRDQRLVRRRRGAVGAPRRRGACEKQALSARAKVPYYKYGPSYNSPCNPPHNKRVLDEEEERRNRPSQPGGSSG
jgi:hypothetical protein